MDAEDALVGGIGGAADEAGGFGALEEAGDVGGFGDEAAGDVALGDAFGAGAGDDAEDVVLGCGEAKRAELLLHAVAENRGGAGDVEQDLLLERGEWLALADFFLEGWCHRVVQYMDAREWGLMLLGGKNAGVRGFTGLKRVFGGWPRVERGSHPILYEESGHGTRQCWEDRARGSCCGEGQHVRALLGGRVAVCVGDGADREEVSPEEVGTAFGKVSATMEIAARVRGDPIF